MPEYFLTNTAKYIVCLNWPAAQSRECCCFGKVLYEILGSAQGIVNISFEILFLPRGSSKEFIKTGKNILMIYNFTQKNVSSFAVSCEHIMPVAYVARNLTSPSGLNNTPSAELTKPVLKSMIIVRCYINGTVERKLIIQI